MKDINKLIKIKQSLIERFGKLGIEETSDYLLIGKAPHIGELAWLHIFYRGLDTQEIDEMQKTSKITLSEDILGFYNYSNGLTLFNGVFNINGIRRMHSRDPLNQQPFSVYTGNQGERPKNSKPSYFFFGSYRYDLSRAYIDLDTGHVRVCERWDASKTRSSWSSFDLFLETEIFA